MDKIVKIPMNESDVNSYIMEVSRLFDGYADTYSEHFNRTLVGRYQRQRVYSVLSVYFQEANTVLDVGCGPGSDFAFFRQFGVQVDALDVSPAMIRQAHLECRRLNVPFQLFCTPVEKFTPPRKYDIILMNFGVANALANLAQALRSMRNWLAPQGKLVIVSMPAFHLWSFLGAIYRLQISYLWNRFVKNQIRLGDAVTIVYHPPKVFPACYRVVRRVALAPLLPAPHQSRTNRLLGQLTRWLMPLDLRLTARLPAAWGGDHICYVLELKNS